MWPPHEEQSQLLVPPGCLLVLYGMPSAAGTGLGPQGLSALRGALTGHPWGSARVLIPCCGQAPAHTPLTEGWAGCMVTPPAAAHSKGLELPPHGLPARSHLCSHSPLGREEVGNREEGWHMPDQPGAGEAGADLPGLDSLWGAGQNQNKRTKMYMGTGGPGWSTKKVACPINTDLNRVRPGASRSSTPTFPFSVSFWGLAERETLTEGWQCLGPPWPTPPQTHPQRHGRGSKGQGGAGGTPF